ncbi:MAG: peptide-methionine (S)-S-oxide reductase MsrA [Lautropia sp.]
MDANTLKAAAVASVVVAAFLGLMTIGPSLSGAQSAAGDTAGKPLPANDAPLPDGLARATFAGGCFWCMEQPFDKLDGVKSTTSGYIGGHVPDPSYEQVSSGSTGHTEAVRVVYDPKVVDYAKLLEVFWVNIDPTVENRQFCDIGSQYRTGIFVHDDAQRRAAQASREALRANKPFKGDVVTEIADATAFTPAEDYHQDYYLKNPVRYRYYRTGCGRDARLRELWGDRAGH